MKRVIESEKNKNKDLNGKGKNKGISGIITNNIGLKSLAVPQGSYDFLAIVVNFFINQFPRRIFGSVISKDVNTHIFLIMNIRRTEVLFSNIGYEFIIICSIHTHIP